MGEQINVTAPYGTLGGDTERHLDRCGRRGERPDLGLPGSALEVRPTRQTEIS